MQHWICFKGSEPLEGRRWVQGPREASDVRGGSGKAAAETPSSLLGPVHRHRVSFCRPLGPVLQRGVVLDGRVLRPEHSEVRERRSESSGWVSLDLPSPDAPYARLTGMSVRRFSVSEQRQVPRSTREGSQAGRGRGPTGSLGIRSQQEIHARRRIRFVTRDVRLFWGLFFRYNDWGEGGRIDLIGL